MASGKQIDSDGKRRTNGGKRLYAGVENDPCCCTQPGCTFCTDGDDPTYLLVTFSGVHRAIECGGNTNPLFSWHIDFSASGVNTTFECCPCGNCEYEAPTTILTATRYSHGDCSGTVSCVIPYRLRVSRGPDGWRIKFVGPGQTTVGSGNAPAIIIYDAFDGVEASANCTDDVVVTNDNAVATIDGGPFSPSFNYVFYGGTATISPQFDDGGCPSDLGCSSCPHCLDVTGTINGEDVTVTVYKNEAQGECFWTAPVDAFPPEPCKATGPYGATLRRDCLHWHLDVSNFDGAFPVGFTAEAEVLTACPPSDGWIMCQYGQSSALGSVTVSEHTPCTTCPDDCSACCDSITLVCHSEVDGVAGPSHTISFTRSGCTWTSAVESMTVSTLVCKDDGREGAWVMETSCGTFCAPDTSGCPPIDAGSWTPAFTIDGFPIPVIESMTCDTGCTCPTVDCDVDCCPEIFCGIDGGIASDGSGNFFGLSPNSDCSWTQTTGSGTPAFPTLTCTDGIWELDFLWSGVHQTYQAAADNGESCCPFIEATNWTQTAGTHTLSYFSCKGDCRDCANSYAFTVNGTGDATVDGFTFTATKTSGCTYTGTGITLTAPASGAIRWTVIINGGGGDHTAQCYMDNNGCPRTVAADWQVAGTTFITNVT